MKRVFTASLDCLYAMLDFIREEVRGAGFEEAKENQIEVALEEAIVNIIKYGYGVSSGQIEIELTRLSDPGIRVVLVDRGIPYDPLINACKVEPIASIEAQPFGGYGTCLMKKMMDHIDYEYKNGCNMLILKKFIR